VKKRNEKGKMEKRLWSILVCLALLTGFTPLLLSSSPTPSELYSGLRTPEATNIISISAYQQYTNPFPLFDSLTESEMIGHGPDGDEPAQPNKGYWSLTVPGWGTLWDRWTSRFGTVVGKSTTKCLGDYSVGSEVPYGSNPDRLWVPNCIFFDFDFVLDVTQWHYLKFYLWLGPGATGYGEFGLKDVNGKWATIQYGPLSLQQWQPMSADIWNQSKWQIDSGFNWSAIVTFGVYASNWYGPSAALIDSPLFYTGPNDLPHGKISFSETETNFSRLFTELYYVASAIESGKEKEYDVYVVHASYRNKATSSVYVLPFVKIVMAMEDVASEYGNTEKPQAGYYDCQTVMTFGISIPPFSVSFPITLPQLQVDFQTSYGSGVYKVEWIVKDPWFVSGRDVVKRNNYADFVIAVKVPKGFKPYVTVMAEAQWYIYNPAREMYHKFTTEQLGWLIVDPPEASPINPEIPNPEPLPTDEIATAVIKEISITDFSRTQPVYFKRGDTIEVWLEIFWIIQDKPLSISVEITDSSGKLIGMVGLLASRYVNGTSRCGFGLQIPPFASTGTAEVKVGLWTNWKWEVDADQYGVDTTQTFDIR
jgi:hypothetical protein